MQLTLTIALVLAIFGCFSAAAETKKSVKLWKAAAILRQRRQSSGYIHCNLNHPGSCPVNCPYLLHSFLQENNIPYTICTDDSYDDSPIAIPYNVWPTTADTANATSYLFDYLRTASQYYYNIYVDSMAFTCDVDPQNPNNNKYYDRECS